MRPDTVAAIAARISATADVRTRTRNLVAAGDWKAAEDDPTRAAAFDARAARSGGPQEAIHGTNDFQPAAFLPYGATSRRAVARVEVQTPGETTSGTGFLISPDLFITNQHVINDAAGAAHANIIFDDEIDQQGNPGQRTIYRLLPERLAIFSDESELDYAVIAIGDRLDGSAAIADLGDCPLSFSPDRHRVGMNVNIIQHPNGLPKTIAIRNNLLTARTDTRLLYETDTDFGSSGAPVFNDQWDVVALHHYGAPSAPPQSAGGQPPPSSVNEGIRISAIFNDLKDRAAKLDPVAQEMVTRALSLWTISAPATKQLERRPVASPPAPGEAMKAPDRANAMEALMNAPSSTMQSVVIPIEILVRVGNPAVAGAPADKAASIAAQVIAAKPQRLLTKAAEGVKLDTDYSNRNGFSAKFVPGIKLDLPQITKPKKSSIAPLQDAAVTSGELQYQNFSVVMHKTRHFALLTATNIDGATYVAIDRKTGEPAATQPEGETWYKDSRMSDSYFVLQDFYSAWSHLFDRGHLTRRDDPTWGEFATRANKDTFHFTNCTPQHWKFNESIKFWQGIERYVLEQGLFVSGKDKPLAVLQGPVFNDTDDLWADDTQVPSAFWKIVVWHGAQGLKAVAMIADQTALFSVTRSGGSAPPPADTAVNVAEYRSTVATIESKTGLDLSAIKPYDTAGGDLPKVGEAVQLIRKWGDIPLT